MVARAHSGSQHEDPDAVVVRDENGFLSLKVARKAPAKESKPAAQPAKK